VRPLPAVLVAGLVATVTASSAPPLAGTIRRAADELVFEWGPVAADLAAIDAARVRLSPRLMRALRTVLARATTRVERVGAGFAALGEAAGLVGDALRRRAQAQLERAPAAEQAAALEAQTVTVDGDAAAIGAAVEVLLADAQLA
jgi:hypothetical protein